MSAIAYYIERAGITTACISLIREHTAEMKPPRSLWVPFPLGRPLGMPNDVAAQHRVLRALLELTHAPSGPVLADYPEDMVANANAPTWACPVSFPPTPPGTSLEARLLSETSALKPWYELAKERRARSSVGTSGRTIGDSVRFLCAFTNTPHLDSPSCEHSLAKALKLAAEDLRAFYLEAATAQPGTDAAADLAEWFWHGTEAGKLLRMVKASCIKHPDRAVRTLGRVALVPRSIEEVSAR